MKIIDITKRMCKQTMDTLDRTRVGKSGSASYDKFYKALLAVKMADRKARITEMKEKTEAVKGEEKQPEAEQEGKQAEGKKQHAGPDAPAL